MHTQTIRTMFINVLKTLSGKAAENLFPIKLPETAPMPPATPDRRILLLMIPKKTYPDITVTRDIRFKILDAALSSVAGGNGLMPKNPVTKYEGRLPLLTLTPSAR